MKSWEPWCCFGCMSSPAITVRLAQCSAFGEEAKDMRGKICVQVNIIVKIKKQKRKKGGGKDGGINFWRKHIYNTVYTCNRVNVHWAKQVSSIYTVFHTQVTRRVAYTGVQEESHSLGPILNSGSIDLHSKDLSEQTFPLVCNVQQKRTDSWESWWEFALFPRSNIEMQNSNKK